MSPTSSCSIGNEILVHEICKSLYSVLFPFDSVPALLGLGLHKKMQ